MNTDSFISEIKDSFKERISSPFIGTFIITFLIFNWKIPIGFLMSKEMLLLEGYTTYYKMIESNTSFTLPIIFTVLYSFSYPWFKQIIKNWGFLVKDIVDQKRLKLKLYNKDVYSKSEYNELKSELETNKEFLLLEENKVRDSAKRINELTNKIDFIDDLCNLKSFDGTWETYGNFIDYENQEQFKLSFTFNNGEICFIKNSVEKVTVAHLKSISFNSLNKELIMVIESLEYFKTGKRFFIYKFMQKSKNILEGFDLFFSDENNRIVIRRL